MGCVGEVYGVSLSPSVCAAVSCTFVRGCVPHISQHNSECASRSHQWLLLNWRIRLTRTHTHSHTYAVSTHYGSETARARRPLLPRASAEPCSGSPPPQTCAHPQAHRTAWVRQAQAGAREEEGHKDNSNNNRHKAQEVAYPALLRVRGAWLSAEGTTCQAHGTSPYSSPTL